MENDLVSRLNNRWTCEFSAAINKIIKLDGKQAVGIVVKAIQQRPIGLRPHGIALCHIAVKDPKAVLALFENEDGDVRKTAINSIGEVIRVVDQPDLEKVRRAIVESSASFKSEKAREKAASFLDKIEQKSGFMGKDSFLRGKPKAPEKKIDKKQTPGKVLK